MKKTVLAFFLVASSLVFIILFLIWAKAPMKYSAAEADSASRSGEAAQDTGSVYEPHRTAVAVEHKDSTEKEDRTAVFIVDLATNRAPIGSQWTAVRENSDSEDEPGAMDDTGIAYIVDKDGWELPAGRWKLDSADGSYRPIDGEIIDLEPSSVATVLVAKAASLGIRVVESNGAPIPQADLRWVSRKGFERRLADGIRAPWDERDVIWQGRTDQDGKASFSLALGLPGVLFATAPGFLPARRTLMGDADLMITLDASADPPGDVFAVSAEDQEPLESVQIWTEFGPVTERSGTDGRLSFQWAVNSSADIFALGPGIVPTRLTKSDISDPEGKLLLLESSRVVIGVTGGDSRPVSDMVVIAEVDMDGQRPSWATKASGTAQPEQRAQVVGGELVLPAARGLPLELLAAGPEGVGSFAFTPSRAEEHVEIQLAADAPYLAIHLPCSDDSLFSAVLRYDNWAVLNLSARSGSIMVPHPSHIKRISIRSPDYQDLSLYPNRHRKSFRSGDVTPQFAPVCTVHYVLRDSFHLPVTGAKMRFSPNWSNLVAYPDLGGARPTDNPSWVQRISSALGGTTDGKGTLTVALVPGKYTVFISPGDDSRMPHLGSLYCYEYPAQVSQDGTQEWTIPGRRLVTVEGIGPSGDPVPSLRVVAQKALPGAEFLVAGSRWQGWVSTDSSYIEVSCPDIGARARVQLDQGPNVGAVAYSVTLGEEKGSLVLTGDSAGLTGRHLGYQVKQGQGVDFRPLEDDTIEIEDPNWTPFFVPYAKALVGLNSISDETGTWTFQPNWQPWSPGAILRFEVIRQ